MPLTIPKTPKPRAWTPAQADRWVWFVDVLFAAIAATAFERAEPEFRKLWTMSGELFFDRSLAALAVIIFFAYDVSVYQVLVKQYPYQITSIGFFRFVLDVLMAFVMLLLLMSGLSGTTIPKAGTAPVPAAIPLVSLLALLTVWHVLAAIWHFLANLEIHGTLPPFRSITPLFGFPLLFWALWGLLQLLKWVVDFDDHSIERAKLWCICIAIMLVSVVRWRQTIRRFTTSSPPDPATITGGTDSPLARPPVSDNLD